MTSRYCANSKLPVFKAEIERRPLVDPKEEVGHRSERGGFACFVGAVDDVQAATIAKIQCGVLKHAEALKDETLNVIGACPWH